MSGPVSFIPPETVAALGAALLHFLWQGTAIAVLAAAAMALCRRPQLRYLLGVSALAAMLAAPVFTVALLAQTGHFVPVTRMAAPHQNSASPNGVNPFRKAQVISFGAAQSPVPEEGIVGSNNARNERCSPRPFTKRYVS